ncbi:16S rRNA (adenine(1518)-N(6)/adenine(1519)-N(6))-dimethyltransferase RsmA [Paracrocinitomix mangrovi]|uniref:16S rRNA (adenine(1518)-N(6)/adenine(1519)-N(6))- dimethyltransferase RsmA n=1 Tax=Paracrocinitomix mangrovi TaxID=2862509 RepID=UPI001C8E0552|nr:16S rRNA (adenine(1518)-N(6)/adenine(1519)-N(6))-dimethyltransferase RsmA [Paracrocinitomix mangrovi]UKN03433.1 16S rRNA (adenine(1518)-N(6)/adenine(1519)-N(6))-dimethyltransferase RsmA [Paracrocinitomix mangrovi]
MSVRPKKHLGQHFLKDESVCVRIADNIFVDNCPKHILEIGPGTGALTKYLLDKEDFDVHVMEIDEESVDYLYQNYTQLNGKIHFADFLKSDPTQLFDEPFAVVGNFPYNISSQILFKVVDFKDHIPLVVGMFQKEVAERVAEKPGSKKYGIISVLIQAWYDVEYLFTVDEHVFIPPPKVKSGVIRLTRNGVNELPCDEKMFIRVVKAAFNQRRKTLRNSLKQIISELNSSIDTTDDFFQKRPEHLSVQDFILLTQRLMA